MPNKSKSPFGPSFNSAIKSGTPCGVVIANIAKRTGKSPSVIGNSLFRAGLCFRQKFNGKFVFWPVNGKKCASAKWKPCHTDMWQNFVDWIISNGLCKPEQMHKHCSSQKEFMTWCRKFFAQQFGPATAKKKKRKTTKRKTTARKRKTTTSRKRKPTSAHKRRKPTAASKRRKTTARRKTSSARVYKFPRNSRSRTTRRRAA